MTTKEKALEAVKELIQMVSTEHDDLIIIALDNLLEEKYEEAFEAANAGITDLEG